MRTSGAGPGPRWRLQDVFDTFAVTPIAAWRNYQEFLARADQNPAEITRLIGASGDREAARLPADGRRHGASSTRC